MKRYSALAPVYDELTKDVDYKRRASFIRQMFTENNITGIVLDAGCGTGTLTLELARQGYDMVGVDASADMLSVAYNKSSAARRDVVFLQQELEQLDLFGTVRAIVCMQDTLNHVGEKLETVLQRFALFLEAGGLLILDINTPYKHQEILADNAFVYPFSAGLCVWQNHYEPERGRVKLTVDVFTACGGAYRRDTDAFYEYTIQPPELEALLAALGFELLHKRDGESYGEITSVTQRIVYVAKRHGK